MIRFYSRSLALIGTALAAATSSPARAAEDPALEERLRAQEERIRHLEAEVRRLSAGSAMAEASESAEPAAPRGGQEAEAAESADEAESEEEVTAKLRGRIQVDASFGSGAGMSSGAQVRRVYLGVEGELGGGFRYLADADFAGNEVNLQDVLIGYQAGEGTEIVAGYFKPSNTQDELQSDVHTLFLERSAFATVFAPGRRIGAAIHHSGRDWGVRAGLFGEREDRTLDDRSEAWLASARIHADLLPGDAVLHAALSAYHSQAPGRDRLTEITQRPEVNRAPVVLDTGEFPWKRATFGGAEFGYGSGPLTIQAEGGALRHNGGAPRFGSGAADPTFWGLSAQAAWRWTGEERPYEVESGTFGRVTPNTSLTAGGAGAFETGIRFTHVDLDDDGIFGGRLTTYGLVLNWFPVERVRLSGNYIRAEVERTVGPDQAYDLVAIRGAVDW